MTNYKMKAIDINFGSRGDNQATRVRNLLANNFCGYGGVKSWHEATVDDLLMLSPKEILQFPNVGKKSLDHFVRVMDAYTDNEYSARWQIDRVKNREKLATALSLMTENEMYEICVKAMAMRKERSEMLEPQSQ